MEWGGSGEPQECCFSRCNFIFWVKHLSETINGWNYADSCLHELMNYVSHFVSTWGRLCDVFSSCKGISWWRTNWTYQLERSQGFFLRVTHLEKRRNNEYEIHLSRLHNIWMEMGFDGSSYCIWITYSFHIWYGNIERPYILSHFGFGLIEYVYWNWWQLMFLCCFTLTWCFSSDERKHSYITGSAQTVHVAHYRSVTLK